MDDYTDDEKLWILNTLITTAKDEKELNYKVLDYCYAYKINQINNMHCDDIEIIRLDNTLEATVCSDDLKLPEVIENYLENRPNQMTLHFIDSLKSDEELLRLYNVKIAKDHFVYREKMRCTLLKRNY